MPQDLLVGSFKADSREGEVWKFYRKVFDGERIGACVRL